MCKNARKLAEVLTATFIRISKPNLFCILGVLCVVTQHSKRCARDDTKNSWENNDIISFLLKFAAGFEN